MRNTVEEMMAEILRPDIAEHGLEVVNAAYKKVQREVFMCRASQLGTGSCGQFASEIRARLGTTQSKGGQP